MLLSFIEVKDLDRFFNYLRGLGFDVEEQAHMVLTDSSEYGLYLLKKSDDIVALMAVHYINTHFKALVELGENASDTELLMALSAAGREGLWRTPVEPLLYVAFEPTIIPLFTAYCDERSAEAERYVELYDERASQWRHVMGDVAEALIAVARGMRTQGEAL